MAVPINSILEEAAQAPPAPTRLQTVGSRPTVSVVVLTWNEARNIRACLDSLSRQTRRDFEVIIIDASSTDETVRIVEDAIGAFPVPLRLHVATTRISIGEARNRGVALARAETIGFLSADAEADPTWLEEGLRSLELNDLVFGRQVHAPTHPNLASSVRGLRYHFPDATTAHNERYASNVASLARRHVLEMFPFGITPGESALDDVLLARRAARVDQRIAYNPLMVVRHRDVDALQAEWAKNAREGRGWGEHADELGLHLSTLLWGALLIAGLGLVAILPGLATALVLVLAIWAPALRRVWRRRGVMPLARRLSGAILSPAFDLVFLVAYLRGLFARRPHPRPSPSTKETHV